MEDKDFKSKTKSKIIQQSYIVPEISTSNNTDNMIPKTPSKKSLRKYFPYILVLLVILLGLSTGYFYKQSMKAKNPEAVAQNEAKALAEKVGKLIVLPTDEVPTIATVSDPEALKNQVFFMDAKKGDKVLIYTNAKKAILYDPVLNKIVTVAPLNIGDKTN